MKIIVIKIEAGKGKKGEDVWRELEI